MNGGLLHLTFIFLVAAVIAVPIAKRLGLGSVLGYLAAGILIGPFGLSLLGGRGDEVMHFAEFGVVMMLFLIGLELQPPLLWKLRGPIFGMGGLQVVISGLLGLVIGPLFDLTWQMGLAIGLILAMSSTAIVLQTLGEKNLLKTQGGQASFAVLLFQDIAVIPILALLPLLAFASPISTGDHMGQEVGMPGWKRALMIIGAVTAIVLAGRYLLRPVFRAIAGTKLRELFTAAALLIVVGIALLMEKVGLSPALGAFVGGVVLANSEYRHELESDIEPFKGLLLGVFFMTVGAGIDFALIANEPGSILGLVALVLFLKAAVLLLLTQLFALKGAARWLVALGLAQGGEFAFVLLSFAKQAGVLTSEVTAPLMAVVALSMAVTPILFIAHDAIARRHSAAAKASREADTIDEKDNPVIIAGYGRFGTTVGRYLQSHGIRSTVLDLDPEQVDTLRRIGMKVYYGDASRIDLLKSAGAEHAKLLVVAVNDAAATRKIVHTAKEHFPHLQLLVRVDHRSLAYEMIQHGIDRVYREVFDSALVCGDEAYRLLGGRAYRSNRGIREFRRRDEKSLRELSRLWGDEKHFFEAARKVIAEEEQLLKTGLGPTGEDHAWDNTTLREDVGPGVKPE